MNKVREIVFFEHYFLDFYKGLRQPVRKKIDWILLLIQTHLRVPEKYLKHLSGTDGLYEIRIQAGNDIFRIFCFFDSGRLIVLMNGFQKKTMKTPVTEIEKAERIKKQYENAR